MISEPCPPLVFFGGGGGMVQKTFNMINIFSISAVSSTFYQHRPSGINILNIILVSSVVLQNVLETAQC